MFSGDSDIFVSPNIPEKKLNNATKAFNVDNYEDILAIYDVTIFGAADEGIVFTGEKMILKLDSTEPVEIPYNTIHQVEYIYEEKEIKPGKTETIKNLFVIFKYGFQAV